MSSTLVKSGRDGRNASALRSGRAAMQTSAGGRLGLIAESFARLAGRPLVEPSELGLEAAMWDAPRAIVAHGTEPEPRFYYANRVALELLGMTATEFIGTIARSLAEPVIREERARLAAGLAQRDIVDIYAVVGIAANGRRFSISSAQVWKILDRHGGRHGLGTTFAEWQFLDGS
jgi:hypothetical protein